MAALLAFALPQGVARAQEVARPQLSDTQKQKTKEHYEKATRLYNVGKYPEAIVEYEAAYLVSADPVMLFNIAQCHRLNSQPEEAARFYKNYLRNAPGAPNREDVERKIAEMERLTEERRRKQRVRAGGAAALRSLATCARSWSVAAAGHQRFQPDRQLPAARADRARVVRGGSRSCR